jgi:hypothetical protein
VIAQLELGVIGLPGLAVGEDGHVVDEADDQMLVEAAFELPASVGETSFYLFLIHGPPPPFPLKMFYRVPIHKGCWCWEGRVLTERLQKDRSRRIPKTSMEGGGRMNEQDLQDILVALLTEDSVQLGERGEKGAEPTFEVISTFEDAGVVSDDKGLVISAGDGSVFLVTIERGG